MDVIFSVVYHYLVVKEDIPKLPVVWKNKIRKAIEEKLTAKPDMYGKPLRRSLKGFRKLRVVDYRIVYRIERTTVKILVIQHRSIVYATAERRVNF